MNPISVTAIQAMVVPVVRAILSQAILTMYGSVNDRMRGMDRERPEVLTRAGGTLLSAAEVTSSGRERLRQIDAQLPRLLRRHRLMHKAVLQLSGSSAPSAATTPSPSATALQLPVSRPVPVATSRSLPGRQATPIDAAR